MVRIELEKAGLSNRIPSGAIITGGGAETVEVIDSARRMLSLPVRIGIPKGVGGLTDDVLNPAFATSIGLVLWGAGQEPQASLTSIGKRLKLPTKGLAGKLIEAVKNLLP
jgi:cell division protein FtsA